MSVMSGDTSGGKLPSTVRLQVVDAPCWLGTLPSCRSGLLEVRNNNNNKKKKKKKKKKIYIAPIQ